MSNKLISLALFLGVATLVVAFVIPAMASAPGEPINETSQLDVGDTAEFEGSFSLTVDDVDQGAEEVTVTLVDLDSNESNGTTINEGETESLEVAGETVDVTVVEILDTDSAILGVSYSSTYGWSDGASLFADQMDVLVTLMGFLLMAAFVMGVVRL